MVTKKQIARKNLVGYWQDVAERAGRTFAQGYLAAWGVASLPALIPSYDKLFTVLNAQTGIAAAVLSVLTALAAKKVGPKDTASFIPE